MSREDEHLKQTIQNGEMGDKFRIVHTIELEEEVKDHLRRVVSQLENQ